jgi:hypothetical protein
VLSDVGVVVNIGFGYLIILGFLSWFYVEAKAFELSVAECLFG